MKKERIQWVDFLRAVAMIFVVYGHQVPHWNDFFVFTSPIKLCLFFAISSFVFNEAVSLRLFISKMIRQIVVPWLVLTITPRIVLIPAHGVTWFFHQVINILTGEAYWYMPCLIISEILWFFILLLKKKEWLIYILAMLSFAAGILLHQRGLLRVCMIDTALSVQLFFAIGYFYKHHRDKFCEKDSIFKRIFLIGGGLGYIGLGFASLLLFPGECLDVHLVRYYNLPLCLAMICLGIIWLFVFADTYLRLISLKLLSFVGRNTLVTYIFHTGVISVLNAFAVKIFGIHNDLVVAVLYTVITVTLCSLISELLHRYLPVLFGKQGKREIHIS